MQLTNTWQLPLRPIEASIGEVELRGIRELPKLMNDIESFVGNHNVFPQRGSLNF